MEPSKGRCVVVGTVVTLHRGVCSCFSTNVRKANEANGVLVVTGGESDFQGPGSSVVTDTHREALCGVSPSHGSRAWSAHGPRGRSSRSRPSGCRDVLSDTGPAAARLLGSRLTQRWAASLRHTTAFPLVSTLRRCLHTHVHTSGLLTHSDGHVPRDVTQLPSGALDGAEHNVVCARVCVQCALGVRVHEYAVCACMCACGVCVRAHVRVVCARVWYMCARACGVHAHVVCVRVCMRVVCVRLCAPICVCACGMCMCVHVCVVCGHMHQLRGCQGGHSACDILPTELSSS